MTIRNLAFGAVIAAGALSAATAHAQDRWSWDTGAAPDARADIRADFRAEGLRGPGVAMLIPELRDSRRGQAWVLRNFDWNRTGFITPREARAANRAFLDYAGPERARFDWDHPHRYDAAPPPPPAAVPPAPPPAYAGGYAQPEMRAYHFRQNTYGAVFNLEDVLFETGSAALRPGAEARLQPLAGYLRSHPSQRVRVDGFTDSVGSDASNLTLSRDRARSVARALDGMGVSGERLAMDGHGEASPVATNTTAEGRQQNRRVEVTLLGARAATFE